MVVGKREDGLALFPDPCGLSGYLLIRLTPEAIHLQLMSGFAQTLLCGQEVCSQVGLVLCGTGWASKLLHVDGPAV